MEELICIGDYAYLVCGDLSPAEFISMVEECYLTGNIQETVIKHGARIVTCHRM